MMGLWLHCSYFFLYCLFSRSETGVYGYRREEIEGESEGKKNTERAGLGWPSNDHRASSHIFVKAALEETDQMILPPYCRKQGMVEAGEWCTFASVQLFESNKTLVISDWLTVITLKLEAMTVFQALIVLSSSIFASRHELWLFHSIYRCNHFSPIVQHVHSDYLSAWYWHESLFSFSSICLLSKPR